MIQRDFVFMSHEISPPMSMYMKTPRKEKQWFGRPCASLIGSIMCAMLCEDWWLTLWVLLADISLFSGEYIKKLWIQAPHKYL